MSKQYKLEPYKFKNTKGLREFNGNSGLVIGLSRFTLVIATTNFTKIRSDGDRQSIKAACKNVQKYIEE